jgi:integrase
VSIRRKGNRWEVRLGAGKRGTLIEQRLPPGATYKDAKALEDALRRRQVEVASGRVRRLIDEAIDEWVATSAQNLKSWDKSLRYKVSVVKDYTAGRYLDELPAVAQEIRRAGLKADAAPATINRHLAVLRRVGNLAEKWGWTDQPLGRRVELLPGETQRHVYLTRDELRAFLAAAGPIAADAMLFAALTGLRRSEMMRLTPAMIVEGCVLLDAATKSGKPRVVPLPPEALRIARKRLPWQITPRQLRQAFEDARKAVQMPHVQLRDLRHTFASWLAQDGANLVQIRDLLGHSSLAVTSRYAHLARPDLRRAVAGLRVGKRAGKKRA